MTVADWDDLQIGDHIVHTKSNWRWVILDSRIEKSVRQIKLRSLLANPPVLEFNGPGPSAYSLWLDHRSASLFDEARQLDMISMKEVFQEVMGAVVESGVSMK